MKHVWTALRKGRREVAQHPFFVWLNADHVPLPDRFVFSPVMIDFIMSFADMNKWFLRYDDPRNEFERAINEHTEEDATHSRFFVENWSHLRLGDISNWSASQGLWWMFQAKQSAIVRRFGMEILRLAVRHPDPLVRFPMMEAIEICGDVFFGNTAPIAQRLAEMQGVEHIYYGKFHRDRESGHLQTDESCFASAILTAEQRQHAESAVALVFSRFLQVLDQLLAFSELAVSEPRRLQRELEQDYWTAAATPSDDSNAAPQYLPSISHLCVHPDQEPLVALLDRRMARLHQHAFLAAIERDSRSPADVLRSFMPVWAIDIVGYKDFAEVVLEYAAPQSVAERAINRWAVDLASHGALYIQDWKALRLDAVVGWRMLDTISYYFLGDHTEVHRSNMARVKKHAMRHDSPLIRWWIMYALERSKQALLERTRPIANEAEAELGITLNYWGYRHGLLEPKSADREHFAFLNESMTEADAELVREVILTVFDAAEQQFALSHLLSDSGVFAVKPPVLTPSRISEIVAGWSERHRPEPSMNALTG
jgi:hypothetical protein